MSLSPAVSQAALAAGYTEPTPIQSSAIPVLSQGRDLVGQARTGTGKTAAFALPLLSRIDLDLPKPQILILTPTRELAIQVAASFQTYGQGLKGLKVLPVYGGQSYGVQLNALKKGVHVIVGTPGRIMDHIKRKTLALGHLFARVLDEADEMLHMGFIEDVEWIFNQVGHPVQTALFSATMPGPVMKIARTYLKDPEEIVLGSKSLGLSTICQKFWLVKGCSKILGLSRILDATNFDGVIVFVKTKSSTLEVCRQLEDKGFRAEALNGDMAQEAREKTVSRLKHGHIDILVATDVAARGLDVDRISHVVNFDMPGKAEPYIHRIGRTGRAGRKGEALIFIYPKERWMIRKLETATGKAIEQIQLPSNKAINKKRTADFKAAITRTLDAEDLSVFQDLVTSFAKEADLPVETVAAALGKLVHGDTPFLLSKKDPEKRLAMDTASPSPRQKNGATPVNGKVKLTPGKKDKATEKSKAAGRDLSGRDSVSTPAELPPRDMDRYRIELGRRQGVTPADIVGAISNEAGLESRYIKGITIRRNFATVDLPKGMPSDIFHILKKTWIRSKPMEISKLNQDKAA